MSLQDVIQVSDGNQIETYAIGGGGLYTYRLGDNASPALPAGWARSIKGAMPIPAPGAPSLGAEVADANALASGATYKWGMSAITPNGESALSTLATHTMTQAAGQTLTLPVPTSIAGNIATARKLYRTRAGGTALFHVTDVPGLASLTLVDTKQDSSLILPAPAADSTALASGIISVTGTIGGTPTNFVETLAVNPSSGQYNVDRINGVLKFALADNGVTVTITYVAAARVEKHLLNDIIDAINTVKPAGFDGFSDGGNQRTSVVIPANTWTQMPTFGGGFTAKGGRIISFASLWAHVVGGTFASVFLGIVVNGTLLSSGTWGATQMVSNPQPVSMMGISAPLSGAITHNIAIWSNNAITIDFYGINHGAWEIPA